MDTIEFRPFPKIARLSRTVIVTEKLDGTNAQVYVNEDGTDLIAGSRTRWITPEDDNHGFARWVSQHKEELLTLGPGAHFGEWWGSGIQRGYGLPNGEKRFSLFNTGRWSDDQERKCIKCSLSDRTWAPTTCTRCEKTRPEAPSKRPSCCGVVPVLWMGKFDDLPIAQLIDRLRSEGSVAAPGFAQPEGFMAYHLAAGIYLKKTLLGDDEPKSSKGGAQ